MINRIKIRFDDTVNEKTGTSSWMCHFCCIKHFMRDTQNSWVAESNSFSRNCRREVERLGMRNKVAAGARERYKT